MKNFVVGVAFCALASATAHAKSVTNEFGEILAARSAQYAILASDTEAAQVDAIGKLSQHDGKSEAASTALDEAVGAVSRFGYAQGRKAALADFTIFFSGKPSAAKAEMWMQGQSDTINRMAAKANSDMVALQEPSAAQRSSYMAEAFTAFAFNSLVRGVADELTLIDQNMASFYQARSAENQERREARASFLSGLSRALSDNASAQQNGFRSMQCQSFGNRVDCTEF